VAERRQDLAAWNSFETIVEALMFEASVRAFMWEPFHGQQLRGCRRARFLLQVPPAIYDAFFNAPVGLRAQFALDPEVGQKSNRELIDSLKSHLIAYVDGRDDIRAIVSSCDSREARIWIDEDEVEPHYHDETPEIDFARWRAEGTSNPGLRAPVGTRLVVLGGWLDRHGEERLNPFKRRRSEEIH
jgi:hypothetical protein